MAKNLRIAGAILLALTIILSCTVVGNKLTDPATYAHTIEVLDHNRTTILGLTAASAAASAAISALPDDVRRHPRFDDIFRYAVCSLYNFIVSDKCKDLKCL